MEEDEVGQMEAWLPGKATLEPSVQEGKEAKCEDSCLVALIYYKM